MTSVPDAGSALHICGSAWISGRRAVSHRGAVRPASVPGCEKSERLSSVTYPSRRGGPLTIDLLWEARDIWIGLYWDRYNVPDRRACLVVYVCLLPCLPLRLRFGSLMVA